MSCFPNRPPRIVGTHFPAEDGEPANVSCRIRSNVGSGTWAASAGEWSGKSEPEVDPRNCRQRFNFLDSGFAVDTEPWPT